MDFEWHDAKNAENLLKHGIDFRWAIAIFNDPFLFEYDDDEPSEDRVNAIGMIDGRLIHVTYTLRDDVCRIISARGAERHERRRYHEDET
jgi:uncharacterized protein